MAELLCSYEDFRDRVRSAMAADKMRIKDENGQLIEELTELDLAIQYVICHYWSIGRREFTEEMLYNDIKRYCGEDVWKKCFEE